MSGNCHYAAAAGDTAAVHLLPVGQAARDQSAVPATDQPRLQLLAGRDADGRRRLAV